MCQIWASFEKFLSFSIFEILQHRKVGLMALRIELVHPLDKWLVDLDSASKNKQTQKVSSILEEILATKRAKNTQKVPSLPLFGHTRTSLGRIHF